MLVTAFLAAMIATTQVRFATCVWIRVENDGTGTGFLIDTKQKRLVTCRHLVADRAQVDVFFPWVRGGELVTSRQEYLQNRDRLREAGLLVTARVRQTSDELDLALLEVETVPPGAKAVRFGPLPAPGDHLRVIGNRLDLETLWTETYGPVRSRGHLVEGYFWRGKKLATQAEALIGQLPIEEGDSGGPVFDSQGQLVGMVAALRRQCPLAAVIISGTAIRRFAALPVADDHPPMQPVAQSLARSTVWVQPTATDGALAGVLLETDLVLTAGKGLWVGDCVGVALPIFAGEGWISQRTAYRDPLTLQLRGQWRSGTVLARDADRDLALIRLDSPVEFMRPVPLATRRPVPGERIHTLNHPGGLEFAWVYAGGVVRQWGQAKLGQGDQSKPVGVVLCQLPAQLGSPGGPVLNDQGQLVGLTVVKEAPQMVAYAVTGEEIAAWRDQALFDRPAQTLAGWQARLEAMPQWFFTAVARGLAQRAEQQRRAGRVEQAYHDARTAVAFDPGCVPARLSRVQLLLATDRPAVALQELDAAVEKGPFDRTVLLTRADLATQARDWRKARGDLERLLAVHPADADARQRLVGVLLELGDDAKAAAAVGDTLRADPKRLPAVATDLVQQAERLALKFPDSPSVPVGWLLQALTAAHREEFANLLQAARAARNEEERLALLRAGLMKIK